MLCSHVVLRQSVRRCHARLASTTAAEARKPRGRPRKTAILAPSEHARRDDDAASNEPPIRRARGRPSKDDLIKGNNLPEAFVKATLKPIVEDGKKRAQNVPKKAKVKELDRAAVLNPKTSATKRARSPKRAASRIPKHHDLASFLEYAAKANLKKGTSVYRGNHYEYTVIEALKRYNFTLQKMGRSNDLGIDLLGTWHLPTEPHELRVLIQCKASRPKPSFVRELEGAYVGAPAGWTGRDVMALLVTSHPATQGVRDALQRSRLPMGFAQITELGHMQQFMWNHAAQESRLTGMSVTNMYRKGGLVSSSADGGRLPGAISLLWMGKQWSSTSTPLHSIIGPLGESQLENRVCDGN